ncbi:TonB-dependent receptor plug domain-containing protein [Thiomicrorhabdus sp.]|uniref:TonB-dependent receptor plug domain-containing protein n=1 Tax=Thiomicrorhabdus sp. TaxID=2039724 RepID=UPI0029C6164C|nr:TonB-dependent receptor plug domain-containing protein [Thiomicrorhabdus sp.]
MKPIIRMKPISLAIAICLSPQPLLAADESGVFTLGAIEVTGQTEKDSAVEVVTQEHIRSRGQTNVGEAIADVPGVTIQAGGRRAETRANIRGFDSRQITLNLDGIPIYIPYDGNIDLSRFLIADLSRIEVSKSLGSLLEGPNNMGGSINLVTRRPDRPLEIDANIGFEAGDDGLFKNAQNIQVGSRLNERFLPERRNRPGIQ